MHSRRKGGDKLAKKPASRIPLTYYRSRSKPESDSSPFQKRTPKKRFKFSSLFSRTVDIVLLASIGAAIIYSLIVQPSAKVQVNSDVYHSKTEYQKAVEAQLKQLQNRNKITLDEAGMVKALRSQFPEISQADVVLPIFGEKPTVKLTVAQPAFWVQSGGQKYVVNNSGTAVVLARNLPEISRLITVDDQSGFAASVGKQILSSGQVNFIQAIIKQSQNAKVPISLIILPSKPQEMDLKTSDRPYYVKFFLGGSSLQQAGQFLAARHQFDQSGQQPAEYLDVRVGGKIYFK